MGPGERGESGAKRGAMMKICRVKSKEYVPGYRTVLRRFSAIFGLRKRYSSTTVPGYCTRVHAPLMPWNHLEHEDKNSLDFSYF